MEVGYTLWLKVLVKYNFRLNFSQLEMFQTDSLMKLKCVSIGKNLISAFENWHQLVGMFFTDFSNVLLKDGTAYSGGGLSSIDKNSSISNNY